LPARVRRAEDTRLHAIDTAALVMTRCWPVPMMKQAAFAAHLVSDW